ncbi:MAG: dihydrolipoyl dehydrogenase [Alphaproteobacteria bacterium]|nr:dihydrolipoyl dehydrogenase [Alphaproteobacteria bacterium]
MADRFDVVVIGGGPGGYNCAIRLGQLGLSAACIDDRGRFGGTCLNVGCIPSKALLHASELYELARKDFARFGITGSPGLDLPAMMAQKQQAVDQLTRGVEFLFRKNKVEGIVGRAKITAPGRVQVKSQTGILEIFTDHVVIATGSEVTPLPGVKIDEQQIVSSTGALSLKSVPKRLLVVGAGIIGLELGSVWRRLGAEVTVVEFLDRIVPGIDAEVARQFHRLLERQGMRFRLSSKVTGVSKGKVLSVSVESATGGDAAVLDADIVLVAIGRRPYTGNLGLEDIGVKLNARGVVETDEHFRTNIPGVWAIGDVRPGAMLAHKAEDEAIACAERIAGRAGHVNYDAIPSVIYTYPEVAVVGKNEEELKQAGINYKVGKFPFTANPRAKTNLTTEGFVKIIADAASDRVLGVHMLGPDVGNMAGEASLAIEFSASSEDIARTSHAHPTLSEAIRQAAMNVDGWAMQM